MKKDLMWYLRRLVCVLALCVLIAPLAYTVTYVGALKMQLFGSRRVRALFDPLQDARTRNSQFDRGISEVCVWSGCGEEDVEATVQYEIDTGLMPELSF